MKEQSHCDVAQGEGGGGGAGGGDLKLFYHVCLEAWLLFLLGAATATLQGVWGPWGGEGSGYSGVPPADNGFNSSDGAALHSRTGPSCQKY